MTKMKVYFETRKEALEALKVYKPTSVMAPKPEEMHVFKFGTGKRSYFVGTSGELFTKKAHGLSPSFR